MDVYGNQHCIVYKFSCDLCNTDYVRYTSRHLFQRIAEHKHSATGKHLKEEHRLEPHNLQDQFTVLTKCRTKFDCLIYKMLFIMNVARNRFQFTPNFLPSNWILKYPFQVLTSFHTTTSVYTINSIMYFELDNDDMESSKRHYFYVAYIYSSASRNLLSSKKI